MAKPRARALITTLLSAECVGVARWATDAAAEYAKGADMVELPEDPQADTVAVLERLRTSDGPERIGAIRKAKAVPTPTTQEVGDALPA